MSGHSSKPQFSKAVADFCALLETAQRDYTWNSESVVQMDRLTQDYLHKLELDGLDYGERAKVATQLAKCRQTRRECKDTTQILEPLVQFLDSEKANSFSTYYERRLAKHAKPKNA